MMWRRLGRWLRTACGDSDELEQRRMLLLEPWREQYLHAGLDGRVHGWFLPLRGGTASVSPAAGGAPAFEGPGTGRTWTDPASAVATGPPNTLWPTNAVTGAGERYRMVDIQVTERSTSCVSPVTAP